MLSYSGMIYFAVGELLKVEYAVNQQCKGNSEAYGLSSSVFMDEMFSSQSHRMFTL